MARMVVAGYSECSRFAHVDHFAEFLAKNLPDFQYHRIVISTYEWPGYVSELNRKNKWNVTQSPIVWTEPGISGGKAYLVGNASDFWEHIEMYYGILTDLTKEDSVLLAHDLYQKFVDDERERERREKSQRHRRVTVSGAGHTMTALLVYELLRVRQLQMELGVIVTLFDYDADLNDLLEIAMDMRGVGADAGLRACRAVSSVEEAFTDCDVLIVLDGRKKEEGEDLMSWLRRNQELMTDLAMDLNHYAPAKCRVVYAAPDMPACFNATVIADVVIDIAKEDVVAITADLGIEALYTITKKCGEQLSDVHCPPVWGFVGINKLVDLRGARYLTEKIVPNKRAKKAIPGTTLPTSTSEKVIYPIGPLLGPTAEGLWLEVAKIKEGSINEMHFAKVQATCDMLGFWFGKQVPIMKNWETELMFRLYKVTADNYMNPKAASLPKGPVISLGILSDGTFEIPEGMNMSQPACLRNGRWVPYEDFPTRKDRYVKLKDLLTLPSIILKELNIGGTLNADYLLSPDELADKKAAKLLEENRLALEIREREIEEEMEAEAREQELNMELRRNWQQLESESEIMIRDNVIAITMRELINEVLDICEPYPEKVDPMFGLTNGKKGEIGGEGGEGEEPKPAEENEEEEEDEDEDDEDDD